MEDLLSSDRPDVVAGDGGDPGEGPIAQAGALDDTPLRAIPVLDEGLHIIAASVIVAHNPGVSGRGGRYRVQLVDATRIGSGDSVPGTGLSRSCIRHCCAKKDWA